jgi:formylglycine-generating enzyme required for sulfatase activity
LSLGLHFDSATAADTPSFVTAKPDEGIAIPVEGGFLVTYTERIPGSDITFKMVPIPGGTFTMGSPATEADRRDDEGPQVVIEVPPKWVSEHEITWAEYKQYMELNDVFEKFGEQNIRPITDANRVDAITAPSKLYEPSFTYGAGEEPNQPAVSMSQYAAKQYTKWLSLLTGEFYRLPTEAEWEYAARAGTTTAYNFGDDPTEISDHAWHYEISDDLTHAVGEKPASAFGLHDMHGNVAEWVLDAYDPAWYAKLAARPQPVPAAEAVNWPTKLYPRVVRGGSWLDDPPALRSAARLATNDEELRGYDPNTPKSPWWFASDAGQGIGFRIVRPWPAPPDSQRGKYWEADIAEIERVVNHRIDEEGRGERGVVDPDLPAAIEKLD